MKKRQRSGRMGGGGGGPPQIQGTSYLSFPLLLILVLFLLLVTMPGQPGEKVEGNMWDTRVYIKRGENGNQMRDI